MDLDPSDDAAVVDWLYDGSRPLQHDKNMVSAPI
jgi:hypothetical protein